MPGMCFMEIIYEKEEIKTAAQQFLDAVEGYKVLCFSGGLGAGKTTFISAICDKLGITETVSSPTYSIIQEYRSVQGESIFHLDLYRLKDEEEAINSGVEDVLYSGDICLVEWPEKVPEVIPEKSVFVQIETLNSTERKLVITLPT